MLLTASISHLETKLESKAATEVKQMGGITLGRNPSLSALPFSCALMLFLEECLVRVQKCSLKLTAL